ncbi:MAG: hypothetical protein H0U58_10065, partial [Chloroflexi bacterium]|nr:hypothetical protein [Chloroflexota bacterium]
MTAGTAPGRPTIDLDGEWRFIPDPERLYRPDALPGGDPIRVDNRDGEATIVASETAEPGLGATAGT